MPEGFFCGNKIPLIWTDPPYGVSYGAKTEALARSRHGRLQKGIAGDQSSPETTEALFVGALNPCRGKPFDLWKELELENQKGNYC